IISVGPKPENHLGGGRNSVQPLLLIAMIIFICSAGSPIRSSKKAARRWIHSSRSQSGEKGPRSYISRQTNTSPFRGVHPRNRSPHTSPFTIWINAFPPLPFGLYHRTGFPFQHDISLCLFPHKKESPFSGKHFPLLIGHLARRVSPRLQ